MFLIITQKLEVAQSMLVLELASVDQFPRVRGRLNACTSRADGDQLLYL